MWTFVDLGAEQAIFPVSLLVNWESSLFRNTSRIKFYISNLVKGICIAENFESKKFYFTAYFSTNIYDEKVQFGQNTRVQWDSLGIIDTNGGSYFSLVIRMEIEYYFSS
jgi:hypothetical protein